MLNTKITTNINLTNYGHKSKKYIYIYICTILAVENNPIMTDLEVFLLISISIYRHINR